MCASSVAKILQNPVDLHSVVNSTTVVGEYTTSPQTTLRGSGNVKETKPLDRLICELAVASFPGPTQLSVVWKSGRVIGSDEKLGGTWE